MDLKTRIVFLPFDSRARGGTEKKMEAMPVRPGATGNGETGVVRRKLRGEEGWEAAR
jgi:hypothetical protein